MNFFFDLDGTLLEVKDKYFAVYEGFVNEQKGSVLNSNEFWKLKRQMKSNEELCELSGLDVKHGPLLKKHIRDLIETDKYLIFDKLISGAKELFEYIKSQNLGNIFIITMRRSEHELVKQLGELGILPYIDQVILPYSITGKFEDGDPLAKSIAANHFGINNEPSMIIGDSGADIRSGKTLGWITVGVLSGLRDENIMKTYEPDYIIDSIAGLRPVIEKVTAMHK
jgi:phosphoglycolate phosphatase